MCCDKNKTHTRNREMRSGGKAAFVGCLLSFPLSYSSYGVQGSQDRELGAGVFNFFHFKSFPKSKLSS